MANGDAAAAAGMDVVPSTASRSKGYDEINKSRDYIANRAKRSGPDIDIWVQATDPGQKAGRIWIQPQ